MNLFNYLKDQINLEVSWKTLQKHWWFLHTFQACMYVFTILFSCFFVTYFVYLSMFIAASHHASLYSDAWVSYHQLLNTRLLVCMVVFWVLNIITICWWLYYANIFFNYFKMLKSQLNHVQLFMWIFGIIGLFICFVALGLCMILTILLIKGKQQIKQLKQVQK